MPPLKLSASLFAAALLVFAVVKGSAIFSPVQSPEVRGPHQPDSVPPALRLAQERLTNALNFAEQKLELARNRHDQAKGQYELAVENLEMAKTAWSGEQQRWDAQNSYAASMSGFAASVSGGPVDLSPGPINMTVKLEVKQRENDLKAAKITFDVEKGNFDTAEATYKAEVECAQIAFRTETSTSF